MKLLTKVKPVLVIFLPVLQSICVGFYVNQVTTLKVDNDFISWIEAIKETGLSISIFCTLIFLLLQIVLYFVPSSSFNKKDTINNLLQLLTEATFHTYQGLDISATVQLCDEKKGKRIVKYCYNTDENLKRNESFDIKFGDIGRTCINKKRLLIKEYSLNYWNAQSQEYRDIVPKELRLIIGEPILDSKRNVIAVLEIDIFEATKESMNGESKDGFLTDEIMIKTVKSSLNDKRNIRQILSPWASTVKKLID